MEWYRAYHGMPCDPKLQVVARRTQQPMAYVVAVWVSMLDAASQHDPRGVVKLDPEELAVIQDIDIEAAERIIQAFRDKGMIDDDNVLTAWAKRQRTTSTERSRESRAKKKQQAADGSTTQHDATDDDNAHENETGATDRTEKNRADSEQSRRDSEEEQISDQTKQNKKKTREQKKGESERKKQQICGQTVLHEMLDIWNVEVQSRLTGEHKAILTEKRKALMSERWFNDFQQDMRAWQYFCEIIGKSEFLLGKLDGKDWTIDLTWAVESQEHVAKIFEGGFSGGSHPPKPPRCEVQELQEAWDFVLYRLGQKHGRAAIRSWFSNTAVTAVDDSIDHTLVTLECPRPFVREWIERHFLRDLNSAFADQPHYQATHIITELKIKEATS